MIKIFEPKVSEKAITYVIKTLKSGWINEGPNVKEFEHKFNKFIGGTYAVSVNSGTSALRLALHAAGIGQGDAVIIPAQTFIATGQAVLAEGAEVIFSDIQLKTGNIDPSDILRKITNKVKAIIPVHYLGYPCDMKEITEIAQQYNLTIIEDAAHAIGAEYEGKMIGTLSRFTCFSFQSIKHISTGDGGMITGTMSPDKELLIRKRWFGIDREAQKAYRCKGLEYDVNEIGFKYNMNDINAAMGIIHLNELQNNLLKRRRIDNIYRKELCNIDGITLLERKINRKSACWMFSMLIEDRDAFIKALLGRNVEAGVWHSRIDKNSIFGGIREDLYAQNTFDQHQVSIPMRESLNDDEIYKIISSIKQGW